MEVFLDGAECRAKGSLCFHPELAPFVSRHLLIGAHLGYLTLVFWLRWWMRTRKAVGMEKPMVAYNVVQVFLSALMATYLAPGLKNGLFNLNGRFSARVEFWVFVHYCSKYLDMLDTVFMICRKKDDQLTFLHLYHHSTIGLIWGLLLGNGLGNGTAFFGAWINSAVHFLMYSHYLWTSFGFRNPLKHLLTKVQMFQFFLCIVQALLAPFLDHQFTTEWSLLQIAYHTSLLMLFLNFYRNSVRRKGRDTLCTTRKQRSHGD